MLSVLTSSEKNSVMTAVPPRYFPLRYQQCSGNHGGHIPYSDEFCIMTNGHQDGIKCGKSISQ